MEFGEILYEVVDALEFGVGGGEFGEELVGEGEFEDLGVDEAPGLVDAAFEPDAQGVEEDTDGEVLFVVDEEEFTFEHDDLAEEVGETRGEAEGEGDRGLFAGFDEGGVEFRDGLGGEDVGDALGGQFVGVGFGEGLVADVDVFHDFLEASVRLVVGVQGG